MFFRFSVLYWILCMGFLLTSISSILQLLEIEIEPKSFVSVIDTKEIDLGGSLVIFKGVESTFPFDVSYQSRSELYRESVAIGAVEVVSKDLLYIAHQYVGLQVVDVKDPSNPVVLRTITHPSQNSGAEIKYKGDLTFLSDAVAGIKIYDTTNATHPVFLSLYSTSQAHSVDYKDGFLFIADYYDGLIILNVTNPFDPQFVSSFPGLEGKSLQIDLDSEIIYFGHSYGLKIFDVSNKQNPVIIGSWSTGIQTWGSHKNYDEDIVFIAGYKGGVHILNVTDSANIELITTYKDSEDVLWVEVDGNYMFLGRAWDGVAMYDISGENIKNPQLLWEEKDNFCTYVVKKYGNTIYTSELNEFIIVDIGENMILSGSAGYENCGVHDVEIIAEDSYGQMISNISFLLDIVDEYGCGDNNVTSMCDLYGEITKRINEANETLNTRMDEEIEKINIKITNEIELIDIKMENITNELDNLEEIMMDSIIFVNNSNHERINELYEIMTLRNNQLMGEIKNSNSTQNQMKEDIVFLNSSQELLTSEIEIMNTKIEKQNINMTNFFQSTETRFENHETLINNTNDSLEEVENRLSLEMNDTKNNILLQMNTKISITDGKIGKLEEVNEIFNISQISQNQELENMNLKMEEISNNFTSNLEDDITMINNSLTSRISREINNTKELIRFHDDENEKNLMLLNITILEVISVLDTELRNEINNSTQSLLESIEENNRTQNEKISNVLKSLSNLEELVNQNNKTHNEKIINIFRSLSESINQNNETQNERITNEIEIIDIKMENITNELDNLEEMMMDTIIFVNTSNYEMIIELYEFTTSQTNQLEDEINDTKNQMKEDILFLNSSQELHTSEIEEINAKIEKQKLNFTLFIQSTETNFENQETLINDTNDSLESLENKLSLDINETKNILILQMNTKISILDEEIGKLEKVNENFNISQISQNQELETLNLKMEEISNNFTSNLEDDITMINDSLSSRISKEINNTKELIKFHNDENEKDHRFLNITLMKRISVLDTELRNEISNSTQSLSKSIKENNRTQNEKITKNSKSLSTLEESQVMTQESLRENNKTQNERITAEVEFLSSRINLLSNETIKSIIQLSSNLNNIIESSMNDQKKIILQEVNNSLNLRIEELLKQIEVLINNNNNNEDDDENLDENTNSSNLETTGEESLDTTRLIFEILFGCGCCSICCFGFIWIGWCFSFLGIPIFQKKKNKNLENELDPLDDSTESSDGSDSETDENEEEESDDSSHVDSSTVFNKENNLDGK